MSQEEVYYEYEYVEEYEDEGEADENMEEEEDDGWFDNNQTSNSLVREQSFTVLTGDDLVKQQNAEMVQVHETCGVPMSIAGLLMRHFQWDKERLLANFFEDPDSICKKAGIVLGDAPFSKGKKDTTVTCLVCYDDVDGEKIASLRCKHWLCEDCWQQFLNVKIDEGPACLAATCPFHNCKIALDETIVSEYADVEHRKRYMEYQARSFVDDNPNIKWCPAPNCGRAINCKNATKTVVRCSCGYRFCFKCSNEAHDPCSCTQLREWMSKEKDESQSSTWLALNTKDCPNCKSSIEKNGGCNHMTCRKCRHEFCWICFGDWRSHNSCNKFEDGAAAEVSKHNMRQELEKYVHYYTRYATHASSLRFESDLRKKADEKMRLLQAKNQYAKWSDVEYIQHGVEQLIEMRSVLKYTYVFAYYLAPGKEKTLFEFLQMELETTTEKLSGLLETEMDALNRDSIVNVTSLGRERLRHLIEGVKNGLVS